MANNASSCNGERVVHNVCGMRNAAENMRRGNEAHGGLAILRTAEGNMKLPVKKYITPHCVGRGLLAKAVGR